MLPSRKINKAISNEVGQCGNVAFAREGRWSITLSKWIDLSSALKGMVNRHTPRSLVIELTYLLFVCFLEIANDVYLKGGKKIRIEDLRWE